MWQHPLYEGGPVNKSKMEIKKTVIDVTGFLCVSLGSSTVQLHDSLGSRRGCACSEAVFSSKMATVFEECITEKQRSVVRFVGKRTQCKRYS
jgi:hypothetical protein